MWAVERVRAMDLGTGDDGDEGVERVMAVVRSVRMEVSRSVIVVWVGVEELEGGSWGHGIERRVAWARLT